MAGVADGFAWEKALGTGSDEVKRRDVTVVEMRLTLSKRWARLAAFFRRRALLAAWLRWPSCVGIVGKFMCGEKGKKRDEIVRRGG